MRVLIAVILVVLFASVFAAEKINWSKIFSQSNIEKAKKIYDILKKKNTAVPESDAEFKKFFKKIGNAAKKLAPIAKKAFEYYNKGKEMGILSETDAEFFKKLGKLVKKVAPIAKKGFELYGKAKSFGILEDQEQSDAQFFKKLAAWWKTKGKKIFSEENIDKAYKIYKIIKNKDAAAPESDAEFKKFFKKIGNAAKKLAPIAKKAFEYYNKGKEMGILSESDAQFFKKIGKFVKKVAPIAKKAFEVYGKAKSFGILEDEAESDAEFFKKLSNWWKTKGKKIFSQENIEKAYKIYKIIKNKDQAAPESDAEFKKFFKKIGNAAKKLAPIAKKAFEYYNKGKEMGILSETDAEFFKKLGKLVKKVAPIAKKGFELYGKAKSFGLFADSEIDFKKWVEKGKKIVPEVKQIVESSKNIAKEGKTIYSAGKNIVKTIRE